MSRRDQIKMTDAEIAAFLDEQRVVTIATTGKDGWPHLMPLWFVVRNTDEIWAWTYGSSQKIKNLERDDRCTLQIEAGESYDQLRGVMFKARATVHRDIDDVAPIGAELAARYSGAAMSDDLIEAVKGQAAKRVGLSFTIESKATWDHRKLGGTY